MEKKRKQRYFFRNLQAEVKTKYRRAVHRMSLKTLQEAQRIMILKFNRELDKRPREILEEV